MDINPPPMTKPEAQVGVIYHMLRNPGVKNASEVIIVDGKLYRITVIEVDIDDAPEVARQFIEDAQS